MVIKKAKKAQIFQAFESDATNSEIAKKFNISRPTVIKLRKEYDKLSIEEQDLITSNSEDNSLTQVLKEHYISKIADQTLLALVDFTDLISRRVHYVSLLPMKNIQNQDLTSLFSILKGLTELDLTGSRRKTENVLESLQNYLLNLKRDD